MANAAALNQLRDLHMPDPVSIWPLAPGWYMVIILGIVLLIALFYGPQRFYKRRRAKWQALKTLAQLQQDYQQQQDALVTVQALSILLRRVTLAYFPRHQVAGLEGQAWLDFLNQTQKTPLFAGSVAELLTQAPYQATVEQDLMILFRQIKWWLKGLPVAG